ncbi:uncharacterized protein LOC119084026 [Bradysia coprophila]|uniref:uncharacterized protein LOC119084026 n=1 Tax=Bradysia coprophila TaxID=38358 RepID=UPI00187DC112|nr:uncharacterized protein LOC119084026 [Bradysia coprophila]
MGIPFNSSETPMSRPNTDNSYNEKLNLDTTDSQTVASIQPPKSIEPAEFDLDVPTIEVISLPTEKIKPEHRSSVKEFFRQLIGITPGIIILLLTGIQLCWAVSEFDMAVYNKMYSDSIYKIGMIIVCGFYLGAMLGQLVGAILVVHLRKKFIYLVCAFLLIVSGELLKNCYVAPYHIIGRILLGLVHSIAQLTVITYASEATTKGIRIKLLSSLAFINMLSIWMGTGLAIGNTGFNEDLIENPENATIALEDREYVVDDLNIVSISGMVIMVIASIALILTPFITRESIPFLVRNKSNEIAYKEFVALAQISENDSSSVGEFEKWKNSILMHPQHSMHIFRKENFKSLMLLYHTRILSLLFNSIFVSVMFTRVLLFDEETNLKWFYNETMSYDIKEMEYSLDVLLGFKTIAFTCGVVLLLFGMKWKINRFCYKLAFVWGLSAFVIYVTYSCLDVMKFKPPVLVMAIFVYSIMTIYMIVPFKLDVLQYGQIAEIYDEENGNYKLWSLAFVGCLEHFLHILLLMTIFLFPSLGALLTDFGIFYISLWLLKNVPSDGAVCPLKNVFRKVTNLKYLKY